MNEEIEQRFYESDWYAKIREAKQNGRFDFSSIARAGNWDTCATCIFGNPYKNHIPEDDEMLQLSFQFNNVVATNDIAGAEATLRAIYERADQLNM